ncbi:methyl-accepting chemotaxis protein [Erythrobacter sp.]|jgi:methyl-accepting chemotaxis protein|uniref:methyl-accepting chemotaxis protein n=1 Tax=Erythrobacter sp. TaxID=1042 RepID=UPI002EBB4E5C|nr:HAMP domain-containing methyl-accepting chemotaxis protein [Erythrobacter sp.]
MNMISAQPAAPGSASSVPAGPDLLSAGEAQMLREAGIGASPVAEAPRRTWYESLSLAGRLRATVIANTVVLALLAGAILGTMAYFGQRGETLRVLSTADANSSNAAVSLYEARDALEDYGVAEDSAALVDARENVARASRLLSEVMAVDVAAADPQSATGLARAERAVTALEAELARDISEPTEVAAVADRVDAAIAELTTAVDGLNARSVAAAEPVFAAIANSLLILLLISVAMVILAFGASRRVARGIADQISNMTDAMQRISSGAIDTVIPGRERSDEIGSMARALEVFRDATVELRTLSAQRAAEAEEQLAEQNVATRQMHDLRLEKSRLLESMADGFEVSVGEVITAVSAASQQLEKTSGQMMEVAAGSRAQADDATEAMGQVTANVTAAAAATDQFALSIGEISRQAGASATLARDASQLVSSANTRMSDLSQAADEIGEIASLIQTIAQRTNLLALNASIEAARGGEAGRGFAVVASEVKELAMQTSNATSSVAEKIIAMQDSTKSSASDLTSIVHQIAELEQTAVMIASAVDEQSVSGEELARNIDTVATGSSQAGERLGALRQASEDTGEAAKDVVESALALGSHAEDLRTKAGRFIDDVRRSARELEADPEGAKAAI